MMMNNLGRLAIFIFIAILNTPVLAGVSAYLNQNTFYEGDSITLTLESDMNTGAKPDFSVLDKDFKVLGTGVNSQINIFNGQRSFKRIWTVEMSPKKKGTLEIPAITIGNEKTKQLSIEVSELPPEIKVEVKKHVFIETSVGVKNNETYVQQQIPYTVKLYYDSAMRSGQITQPDVENAVVEQLGQDNRYREIRGGKEFNVVEKHFTISPEKSGTLKIHPTSVTGRIALSGGDSPQLRRRMDGADMLNKFFNDSFFNDPFFKDRFDEDLFRSRRPIGPTQPFTVYSQSLDINVLPVAKDFTGKYWLPAEELNIISDSWSFSPPVLKVGEPVTRTIALRVKGLGGSQIPAIDVPKPDNVKIYQQQPSSKTHTDGTTLIGTQYIDITYIPQKKGKVTIPEIKIDWWNTKIKKQETLTMPAWHLNVAPGELPDVQESTSKLGADKERNAAHKKNEKTAKIADANNAEIKSMGGTSDTWQWKKNLLFVFVFLFLSGLIFVAYRFKERFMVSPKQGPQADIGVIKTAAIQACKNNNKKAASSALLKLVQAQWRDNSIQNLGAVISNLESGSGIVKELNTSLYAANAKQWNGAKLVALIESGLQRKQGTKIVNNDLLEPLYPDSGRLLD